MRTYIKNGILSLLIAFACFAIAFFSAFLGASGDVSAISWYGVEGIFGILASIAVWVEAHCLIQR